MPAVLKSNISLPLGEDEVLLGEDEVLLGDKSCEEVVELDPDKDKDKRDMCGMCGMDNLRVCFLRD